MKIGFLYSLASLDWSILSSAKVVSPTSFPAKWSILDLSIDMYVVARLLFSGVVFYEAFEFVLLVLRDVAAALLFLKDVRP